MRRLIVLLLVVFPAMAFAEQGYYLVDMKSVQIGEVSVIKPDLPRDLKNYIRVGKVGDKVLIITQDSDATLDKEASFIDGDWTRMLEKANKGNAIAKSVILNNMMAIWDHGKDKDGNPVIKQGTLQQWYDAKKPKLLGPWTPRVVILGKPDGMPDQAVVEGVVKALEPVIPERPVIPR